MTKEERKEIIGFCKQAINFIEDVEVEESYFDNFNDEQLTEKAEFLDYLLDK